MPGLVTRDAWLARNPPVFGGAMSSYDEGLMERVAANRRLSLEGYRDGVALLLCGDLGRTVWIKRPGFDWDGPFRVVDCSAREHLFVNMLDHGIAVEVGFRTAQRYGRSTIGRVSVSLVGRSGAYAINYATWWRTEIMSFMWTEALLQTHTPLPQPSSTATITPMPTETVTPSQTPMPSVTPTATVTQQPPRSTEGVYENDAMAVIVLVLALMIVGLTLFLDLRKVN